MKRLLLIALLLGAAALLGAQETTPVPRTASPASSVRDGLSRRIAEFESALHETQDAIRAEQARIAEAQARLEALRKRSQMLQGALMVLRELQQTDGDAVTTATLRNRNE
jgi:hypothetical protein